MKKETHKLYLSSAERKIYIYALNIFRNELIQEGRYTDEVDELMCKVIKAKKKKVRVEE